jgi:hypothetical protein
LAAWKFYSQNRLLQCVAWANRCSTPPPCRRIPFDTYGYQTCEPNQKLLLNNACQGMQTEWMTNYHQFLAYFCVYLRQMCSPCILVWPRFLFRSTCWLPGFLSLYIYSSPVSAQYCVGNKTKKKQPQFLSLFEIDLKFTSFPSLTPPEKISPLTPTWPPRPRYYKMWVQFTNLCSLEDQWTHYFSTSLIIKTSEFIQNLMKSL